MKTATTRVIAALDQLTPNSTLSAWAGLNGSGMVEVKAGDVSEIINERDDLLAALQGLVRKVEDTDFTSETLRENAKRGAKNSALLRAKAAIAKVMG